MKLSVLFVDDDSNIISGLKRMMYPLKNEWDLFFALGGKEALELLNKNKIDVIISDIRMPGIDGTQLLTEVKDKYPQIVRITLSGYANDNLSLRNTRIVHQSLSKPTTSENVKLTIEKTFRLREKLKNEELLKIVNGLDELPSLPEIYLKLEKEINSPNSSIDKLSNIISTDPIITAKILQLTNSAFFGLPTHITNIKQALNYLGIKIIQNLVLTIKLFKSMDKNHPNSALYLEIWNHCNKVALMAQELAKNTSSNKTDIEDSFLAGLLHDIGKIILLDKYSIEEMNSEFSSSIHADIGAYLLGIWGFPDNLIEAVAFHHQPELIDVDRFSPTRFVYIANNIVNNTQLMPDEIHLKNIDSLIKEFGNSNGDLINESKNTPS